MLHAYNRISYLSIFIASGLLCADIQRFQRPALFASSRLGDDVELSHDGQQFYVHHNAQDYPVAREWLNKNLRNITPAQLAGFLQHGHVEVVQADDGTFSLKARTHGPGGGPLLAGFLYSATKATCYGAGIAAAATGVVVVGAGVPGALAGAGLAATTGGASAGASLVAGAIAGGGCTAAAVEASTAVVMAAGGLAQAAAMVEAASIAAGALGAAVWFLP